jgi:hypothetical protein
VSKARRRGLGWAIAIALVSATAAWGADVPREAAYALRVGTQTAYKLELPRVISDMRGPPRLEHVAFEGKLKEIALDPDLQLQGRWFVDASTNLGGEPFYSLEEQVAYFVAHEPSLAVQIPPLGRSTSARIELATLELHLPF